MAEAPDPMAELQDQEENIDDRRTMAKPPNKKKFEEEQEALTAQIKQLEEEKTKLMAGLSGKALQVELQSLHQKKNEALTKRKEIDVNLQKLNQNVGKQNSELTKVESTLKYKSEERTNETINRLDQQLKLRNFTLREERRIVSEIDALKRSKKALGLYMTMKKELDGLKDQGRRLREQRETLFRELRTLKQREDSLRAKAITSKTDCERIKKDLDILYAKKRTNETEFRQQQKEYQILVKKRQEEQSRKKREEKLQRREAIEQEKAEIAATRNPHQDKIQLCNTLLTHLHRFVTDAELGNEKSPENTLENIGQEMDGMYMLKKKVDAEDTSTYSKANRRRTKRDRRRTLSNKPIYHSPEIFEQFAQLELRAPTLTAEVPQVIHQLEQTKDELANTAESSPECWNAVDRYLQSLSSASSPQVSNGVLKLYGDIDAKDSLKVAAPPSAESTSSRQDTSSVGPESAIYEDSVPSTPEVLGENIRPSFRKSSSPVPSEDSGTVSLDNVHLNRPTSPTTSDNSTLVPDESPSSRSDSLEDTRTESLDHDLALVTHSKPSEFDDSKHQTISEISEQNVCCDLALS